MSILAKAVRLVGTVWLWGAGLLIVSSHLIVLHVDGFWALIDLLNPWNVASGLTLDLTVAPGLLLHMAADQLTGTASPSQNRPAIIPGDHQAPNGAGSALTIQGVVCRRCG